MLLYHACGEGLQDGVHTRAGSFLANLATRSLSSQGAQTDQLGVGVHGSHE